MYKIIKAMCQERQFSREYSVEHFYMATLSTLQFIRHLPFFDLILTIA